MTGQTSRIALARPICPRIERFAATIGRDLTPLLAAPATSWTRETVDQTGFRFSPGCRNGKGEAGVF